MNPTEIIEITEDEYREYYRASLAPCIKENTVPHALFHYTNIDTLALILEDKTLRLNSIEKMDDLEEADCFRLKSTNIYTYASCWTNDSRESIPMWHMYTNMFAGIRIEMPPFPFENMDKKTHQWGNYDSKIGKWFQEEEQEKNIWEYIEYLPMDPYEMLYRVRYTENPMLLKPWLSYKLDNHMVTYINEYVMGIFKRINWDFQHEYRYVIHLGGKEDFYPKSYYDLELSEEALKQMKIVMSPKFSDGNYILLKNLLKEFSIDIEPQKSSLTGTIR